MYVCSSKCAKGWKRRKWERGGWGVGRGQLISYVGSWCYCGAPLIVDSAYHCVSTDDGAYHSASDFTTIQSCSLFTYNNAYNKYIVPPSNDNSVLQICAIDLYVLQIIVLNHVRQNPNKCNTYIIQLSTLKGRWLPLLLCLAGALMMAQARLP